VLRRPQNLPSKSCTSASPSLLSFVPPEGHKKRKKKGRGEGRKRLPLLALRKEKGVPKKGKREKRRLVPFFPNAEKGRGRGFWKGGKKKGTFCGLRRGGEGSSGKEKQVALLLSAQMWGGKKKHLSAWIHGGGKKEETGRGCDNRLLAHYRERREKEETEGKRGRTTFWWRRGRKRFLPPRQYAANDRKKGKGEGRKGKRGKGPKVYKFPRNCQTVEREKGRRRKGNQEKEVKGKKKERHLALFLSSPRCVRMGEKKGVLLEEGERAISSFFLFLPEEKERRRGKFLKKGGRESRASPTLFFGSERRGKKEPPRQRKKRKGRNLSWEKRRGNINMSSRRLKRV